jgi:transcriptional regulator with XRE-family HTH domain
MFDVLPCTVPFMSKSAQPRYLDGEALRKARLAAGLEQAELADRCGAKQGQISGWERGWTGCRIGMLHKLAKALGCDPAGLMLAGETAEENEADDEAEPDGAAA